MRSSRVVLVSWSPDHSLSAPMGLLPHHSTFLEVTNGKPFEQFSFICHYFLLFSCPDFHHLASKAPNFLWFIFFFLCRAVARTQGFTYSSTLPVSSAPDFPSFISLRFFLNYPCDSWLLRHLHGSFASSKSLLKNHLLATLKETAISLA